MFTKMYELVEANYLCNELEKRLNTEIRAYEKNEGMNAWRACIRRGILKNKDILANLSNS